MPLPSLDSLDRAYGTSVFGRADRWSEVMIFLPCEVFPSLGCPSVAVLIAF